MSNLRDIASENAKTFYDARTRTQHSLLPKYIALTVISIVGSWIFNARADNLYMSVIAAQSILVGFSFNVMVFLASNPHLKIAENASVERKQKVGRLNQLSNELFYNLSYFNIVAIASVIVALLMLLVPMGGNLSGDISEIGLEIGLEKQVAERLSIIFALIAKHILLFIFYFALIDSIASFIRIIRRASYYFESKMALAK